MSAYSVIEIELRDGVKAKALFEEGNSKQSPIVVDFLSGRLRHRLATGVDGEAIVKAIGVKRSERSGVLIYDFTAGLGTEAFLLASAGFSVVAFERNPLVFELLQDGLKRWRDSRHGNTDELNLEFRFQDVVDAGPAGLARAYAATIDPMFDDESVEGKSLPKKEMATLRRMLPANSIAEARELFHVARSICENRIVVKRPAGSEDLFSDERSGLRPIHRIEGKSARFDIYSCR